MIPRGRSGGRPDNASRPTLLKVLRRAHLNVALAMVTISGLALTVLSFLAISAYARHNLCLIARSSRPAWRNRSHCRAAMPSRLPSVSVSAFFLITAAMRMP